MTDASTPPRSHTEGPASPQNARDDGPDGGGLFVVGIASATLFSALTSLIALAVLPARLRIHWTLGAGPYYGPEFAPALLVLGVFPVLVGAVAVAAYGVGTRTDALETSPQARTVYQCAVAAALTGLVLCQVVLVVANL